MEPPVSDKEFAEHVKVRTHLKGVPKHTFVMFYMNGCGPCNQTKPLWMETAKYFNGLKIPSKKQKEGLIICAIESKFANLINKDINGYPTFCYYLNGQLQPNDNFKAERSVQEFVNWINKAGEKKSGGKTKKRRPIKKSRNRSAPKKRKWFFF